MAKYEMMFITRPDIPEEELDKLIAQMEGVISGMGGKTERVDKMGRRRLAYRIQRQREGFYLLFVFEGTGDTVREFERRLKVSDAVIKYMSVRADERLKPTAEPAAQTKPAAEEPAPQTKPAAAEPAAAEPASSGTPAGEEAPSQS
ncbi:MAG TPA: 30S ribosomal protein S6 [Terriglobia bacterium]|nr:30S ribosomal protein S6 [Terriglobia bacterium]